MSERPLWFGSDDRPLFGWLGSPEGDARSGVVLCSPIGSNARAAHWALRILAEQLRAEGFATLRFDYDGCGDSAGDWSDPDRIAAWTRSIGEAISIMRATGVRQVSAVGMRLGASILCEAAPALSLDLESAVLWDPVSRGKRFLREEQLLLAVAAGNRETRSDGAIETSGYLVPAAMASELATIDLRRTFSNGAPARRSLVLLRPGVDRTSLLTADADPSDVGTEFGAALGQESLLEVSPDLAELPLETMSEIVSWLAREERKESAIDTNVGRRKAVIRSGTDQTVLEHHHYMGAARLSAIFTEPMFDSPNHTSEKTTPWMVFLNNGAETRIGPGRSWVTWSRSWAREGIRSVRVDLSGLGDSGVNQGQDPRTVYSPYWLDDVREIIDTISSRDGSEVVIIGLCSGAYSALEAALSPHPPRGVVAINPILRTDTAHDPRLADSRRRAWRPRPKVLSRLSRKHPLLAHRLWRACRELAITRSPMDVFAKATRAGVDVLAIFGPGDMWQFGKDLYWTHLGRPHLERDENFEFVQLTELDHSLYLDESQNGVEPVIRKHLLDRYVPDAGHKL